MVSTEEESVSGTREYLHRYMYQLDKIANEAHNSEANCDCL